MVRQIPESIINKLDKNLHTQKDHPIAIVKTKVIEHLQSATQGRFEVFQDLPKKVRVRENFDVLRIPKEHPSRSESDTFYINEDTVLRTHTSAHQHELLKSGKRNFLIIGDVYRRDEVNRTHFPVFHQLEGVMQCGKGDPSSTLRDLMKGLATSLFPDHEQRINDDYFPFTTNGIEMEIEFGGDYIEILGGGVVHSEVKANAGVDENERLIAWGLGLERLAMILFSIPDIRLFWSEEPQFLSQFSNAQQIKAYQPFSAIQAVDRDISFFVNDVTPSLLWTSLNEFYEFVRDSGDDMIESIVLYDRFYHPKFQKHSHTFRIRYSPVADCTNAADLIAYANSSIASLRTDVAKVFNIELR